MRRTKEEAAETRRILLEAALRVFSRKGYTATTLNDIADEANVTRGAIYWHFGSKAELYSVLVQERMSQALAPAAEIKGKTPLDTLRRLLLWTLQLVEDNPSYRAVLEMTLFKTEVVPELEDGMAKKSEAMQIMIQQYGQLIQAAIESGEVRSNVDVETAALAAVGLTGGLVSLWLQSPQSFSIKTKAESLVDLYLNALC